jgi:hypothetical protein
MVHLLVNIFHENANKFYDVIINALGDTVIYIVMISLLGANHICVEIVKS